MRATGTVGRGHLRAVDRESTSPYASNPNGNIAWRANTWFTDWPKSNGYYKYLWWGRLKPDGSYDFTAWGHMRQRIYIIAPEQVVRGVFRHLGYGSGLLG